LVPCLAEREVRVRQLRPPEADRPARGRGGRRVGDHDGDPLGLVLVDDVRISEAHVFAPLPGTRPDAGQAAATASARICRPGRDTMPSFSARRGPSRPTGLAARRSAAARERLSRETWPPRAGRHLAFAAGPPGTTLASAGISARRGANTLWSGLTVIAV